MRARPNHSAKRKAISIIGLTALIAATLQVMAAPAAFAAPPIFLYEFANLTNWTATRITLDNTIGSPTLPSARAQVTNQSASAFRVLGTTTMTPCMSLNVNLAAGSGVALFRLRSAANDPIRGVRRWQRRFSRSDSARPTAPPPGFGPGWHNVELCGPSDWPPAGTSTRRHAIVTNWGADTARLRRRIQIGDRPRRRSPSTSTTWC